MNLDSTLMFLPNLNNVLFSDYEKLLVVMTEVYKNDKNSLCEEYWFCETMTSPNREAGLTTKQVHERGEIETEKERDRKRYR